MQTTEKTLAQFIAEKKLSISFAPVRAAQEKESEFKTWRLHYVGVVSTSEGKEEMFTYFAGYGCAMSSEKIQKIAKRFNPDSYSLGLTFGERQRYAFPDSCKYVAEKIFKGTDASRFTDQKTVGQFMDWLLRNWKPDAESFLNCLKLEAQCGEYSFNDFCANLGYDEDSRQVESTWRACQESGRKLRNLLGHKAFTELLESTESL